MFEKLEEEIEVKADEYALEESTACNYGESSKHVYQGYFYGFLKGAEFGYNKANEWHYVKDGDLPKDDKNYRSYVVAYYGAKGSSANGKPCWEELCYDSENKRWVDKDTLDDIPYVNQEGIVIAWKEIVLPKELRNV